MVVFNNAYSFGSLEAFTADDFSLVLLLTLSLFLVFLIVEFFLGFSVDAFFWL